MEMKQKMMIVLNKIILINKRIQFFKLKNKK